MRRALSVRGWLLLSLAIAASGGAEAHAHLQASTPGDGSILARPPLVVVLQFSEGARLTALSIERSGGPTQKLTPLPQEPQTTITVALPKLPPGDYVVSWRVLGRDGHVVPGRIRFTLRQ